MTNSGDEHRDSSIHIPIHTLVIQLLHAVGKEERSNSLRSKHFPECKPSQRKLRFSSGDTSRVMHIVRKNEHCQSNAYRSEERTQSVPMVIRWQSPVTRGVSTQLIKRLNDIPESLSRILLSSHDEWFISLRLKPRVDVCRNCARFGHFEVESVDINELGSNYMSMPRWWTYRQQDDNFTDSFIFLIGPRATFSGFHNCRDTSLPVKTVAPRTLYSQRRNLFSPSEEQNNSNHFAGLRS